MAVTRIEKSVLQMSIVSEKQTISLEPKEINFIEIRKDFSRIDIYLNNNDIIMCGDCHSSKYTLFQTWCEVEKVDYRVVEK